MVVATPLEHVARSDCERIRPGLITQPSNTLSSLAYVAVGALALPDDAAIGLCALLAGAGSVAYHGPGGRLGHAVHDIGGAALAVAWATRLGRPALPRWRRRSSAVVMALGVALHAGSRTDRPLCCPESHLQVHGAWHVLSALSVALVATRTGAAQGSR